jgi:hypothetical protein
MNDQLQATPNDKLPLAASLSGKNMFIIQCVPVGRGMQYASCQARQAALNTPGVKVPEDWKECGRHKVHGECEAHKLRQQELEAGHAIFFRESGAPTAPVSRRWGEAPIVRAKPKWNPEDNVATKPVRHPVVARTAAPAPQGHPPKETSIADAIGKVGTYADAINKMAAEQSKPAAVIVTKPQAAPPQLLKDSTEGIHPPSAAPYIQKVQAAITAGRAGETPLQMARRIRAEREAAAS